MGWTYLESHQRFHGRRRSRKSRQRRTLIRTAIYISRSPTATENGRPARCSPPTICDLELTSGLSRATSTTWIKPPSSDSSPTGLLITVGPTQKMKSTSNFPSGTRPARTLVMPTSPCTHPRVTTSRKAFPPGGQLPGQWWKPHHGKNGMEIRSNRVHADEWRSSHRLCRRCYQD